VEYEWDPAKAAANLRKHGVDFADAASVLSDPLAATRDDDHPSESRRLTLGVDAVGRLLVVCYVRRGTTVRIIRLARPRLTRGASTRISHEA
jgi:Uncharacterized protein conserved in bacteria